MIAKTLDIPFGLYNKKTKQRFLKSISAPRLRLERKIKNTDIFFDLVTIGLSLVCVALLVIYMRVK